jgi:hypothetical protein
MQMTILTMNVETAYVQKALEKDYESEPAANPGKCLTMLDPMTYETLCLKTITPTPFPFAESYFHAQKKPLVTCDINIVRPEVQRNQFESDPSKTFHERFALAFFDGAVEADDYLGDGEDGFGEFDESHEPVQVRCVLCNSEERLTLASNPIQRPKNQRMQTAICSPHFHPRIPGSCNH